MTQIIQAGVTLEQIKVLTTSIYQDAIAQGVVTSWDDFFAKIKSANSGSGEGTQVGVAGKSAYELAVQQGFVGTLDEWLLSLKGESGQKGEDGNSPVISEQVTVNTLPVGSQATAEIVRGENNNYSLTLNLPAQKEAIQPEFNVIVSDEKSQKPEVSISQSGNTYTLTFKFPEFGGTGSSGEGSAVDLSGINNQLNDLRTTLDSIAAVKDLDSSGSSTFYLANTSDLSTFMSKSGIFYMTNTTHLKTLGFPSAAPVVLTVIYISATVIYWEATSPTKGVKAVRAYQNGKWGQWSYINLINFSRNPQYHADNVVTLGSSTLATMKDSLESAITSYGVKFINRAYSGSFLSLVAASVGIGNFRVKFPAGLIPAKGSTADIEIVHDLDVALPISLHSHFFLLQNGVKGSVSGATMTPEFSPTNTTESLSVDSTREIPAQLYVLQGYSNGISIISSGKNDISNNAKASTLTATFEKIVDALKPDLQPRFLVVGQYSNVSYTETQKAELDKYNAWQKQTYGLRYFDLLAYLQSDECKNAMASATGSALSEEDAGYLADGKLPVAWSVEGTAAKAAHMNNALMALVANKIVAKLVTLGYFGAPTVTWDTSNYPCI